MQPLLKKAFTLMEMMAVVVIVGVIALFAIPNFSKTMEGSYEQNAGTQLTSIHAANNIYNAQNGTYWPVDASPTHTVTDINTNLSMSIMENGMTYNCSCTSFNGATSVCDAYACTATRGSCVITVTNNSLSTTNPSSTAACATYSPSS